MPFVTEELWAGDRRGRVARDDLLALARHGRASPGSHDEDGRSRDRLGDRPRHRDPLGARGDEHHAGPKSRWCSRACRPRPDATRRPLGRRHQAAGAARRACPSPTRRPRARCSSWCAARSRRCRSRASSTSRPRTRRLEKELAKVDADIARVDAKLGNADFRHARARGGGRGRAREARGGAGAPRQDPRGAGAAEMVT